MLARSAVDAKIPFFKAFVLVNLCKSKVILFNSSLPELIEKSWIHTLEFLVLES